MTWRVIINSLLCSIKAKNLLVSWLLNYRILHFYQGVRFKFHFHTNFVPLPLCLEDIRAYLIASVKEFWHIDVIMSYILSLRLILVKWQIWLKFPALYKPWKHPVLFAWSEFARRPTKVDSQRIFSWISVLCFCYRALSCSRRQLCHCLLSVTWPFLFSPIISRGEGCSPPYIR